MVNQTVTGVLDDYQTTGVLDDNRFRRLNMKTSNEIKLFMVITIIVLMKNIVQLMYSDKTLFKT